MTLRRIVVELGAPGPATLPTAIELARALEAELVGLFVEDIDLLALAALPFGEVGFPSAARRELDVDAMERSLRAKARRVRRELDARLAGIRVRWTFETVRGRPASALTTIAAADDVVVVPVARAAAGRRAGPAYRDLRAPWLIVCDALRTGDGITIVPPAGAPADVLAEVVAALAPRYGRSALFVPVDGDEARQSAWRRDLQRLLAERAVSVRFHALADDGRVALERLVVEERARIVVVQADTAEARDALLA